MITERPSWRTDGNLTQSTFKVKNGLNGSWVSILIIRDALKVTHTIRISVDGALVYLETLTDEFLNNSTQPTPKAYALHNLARYFVSQGVPGEKVFTEIFWSMLRQEP